MILKRTRLMEDNTHCHFSISLIVERKKDNHFSSHLPTIRKRLPPITQLNTTVAVEEKYISLNVGRARRDFFGELKVIREKRLPVRVKETASALELKFLAIDKHSNHDQEFCALESYVMLYPDLKEVTTLPGNMDDFRLNKYRDCLGKPYSQMVLYLCTSNDFFFDVPTDNAISTTEVEEIANDTYIPAAPDLFGDTLLNGPTSDYYSNNSNEMQEISAKNVHFTFCFQNIRQLQIDYTSQKNLAGYSTKTEKGVQGWYTTTITIKFIGEEAADAGGPLKEFFSVLFDDARNYLCSGNSYQFTFTHDLERVSNGNFFLFGNLIGMALISGCAGPRYLMPAVVSKMFNKGEFPLSIDDVPDLDVQTKLKELDATTNDSEFQSCLESFPERYNAGVTNVSIAFEDKSIVIQNICKHYCLSVCLKEVQQVVQGMDILGLYSILQQNYEEIKTEFVPCMDAKAQDLLAVFKNVIYTVNNDNNVTIDQSKEEDIYYNFTNFIEALENDNYKLPGTISLDDDGKEEHSDTNISLRDVIQFCTGSKYVLPCMKENETIEFIHPNKKDQGKRIIVYTCNYKLVFPVTKRYYGSTEAFNRHFCEDVATSPGFGIAACVYYSS
ncbi:uncharacterized protein LOC130630076 [Hydractinia symbiolongicarpus]|uniref:uncharacterized protein LOC130630076 n=1 Tax=Hydractinia symbiolongicarpus TaxID=13093 RepID=UPI00254C644A|nr:uncharacterized protein LOC130630076 [Hydractinia symbiolongicarpus]